MLSFLVKLVALSSLAALAAATHEPRFAKLRRNPGIHVPSPTLATLALAPSAAPEAPLSSNVAAASAPLAEATSSPVLADSTSLAYLPSSIESVAAATTSPSSTATATAPPSIDVTVLQLAFVLENLEATFYQQALERFSFQVMVDAGLSQIQSAIIIEQVTQILVDENRHVAVLADTIIALGAEPFSSCGFNFDQALSDPVSFLQTARVLEAVGVSAYLGAAHLLTDPSRLLAASSIVTLEARHQSLLNVLNGGSFGPQQSFDLPLTPQGVLAIAGGFLVGCDASELGLTANAALTVIDEATAVARFVPGSKLALSVVNVEVDLSGLTCQLLLGGQAVALTFAAADCYIPAGVDGPVAVYLTNTSTPLATNVVIQAQQTIVAGPGFIFVDAEVTVLASVLSPFASANDDLGHQGSSVAAAVAVEVAVGVHSSSSSWSSSSPSLSDVAPVDGAPAAESASSTSTAPQDSALSPYRLDRRRVGALPTIQESLGKRRLSS
ncbi:uncharacterized protein RHOBADRAFT_47656 [Rhodotorula graminis WP1]|uniref:Ferritin-like domain-containing protein n=1 Tax=Rhodotorula graminis (strain WP1) TaxID=578459 RepID=A0A0P9EEA0_RHOGW|nr:uncharacterized protein RHOBADRAFT_47656 [Rhodotorula graminis WP1]KPV71699.1 hypothetical protein RHOBADRAFT_47656 [Rhodotorula graminis WP1]